MPIVLEFARYLFVPAIREYLKQATDTGLTYSPLRTLVLLSTGEYEALLSRLAINTEPSFRRDVRKMIRNW